MRRIGYPHVASTLALIFAMSGGAVAATQSGGSAHQSAHRYLITNIDQLSPAVRAQLRLHGLHGPAGKTGPGGAVSVDIQEGKPGPRGPTGVTGNNAPGREGPQGRTGPEGKPGEKGEPGPSVFPGGLTKCQSIHYAQVALENHAGVNAIFGFTEAEENALSPSTHVAVVTAEKLLARTLGRITNPPGEPGCTPLQGG